MFLILYTVFTTVFPIGQGVPHYPVYLFIGIILWNFFTEMTQQSLGSIVGRGDLIRKIRIPRWMIVFSTSLNALINLFLNLAVLVVFMALNQVDLMASIFWLPFIIIEVYVLGLGVSFFLAALFVRFRQYSIHLGGGYTGWFLYLTPILYPLTRITRSLCCRN